MHIGYLILTDMFRSYLIIAWRNLLRNRTLSFINISGLTVGMTFTLLICLWIRHELSFDRFHADDDRIGMVMKNVVSNDIKGTKSSIPLPLYDELLASYPEIENITRLSNVDHNLRVDDKVLIKSGSFVDQDFLKIFSFKMRAGDGEKALTEPASIVLTSSLAITLFGDTDPVGKLVRLDNKHDVIVTGVLEDVPTNSSLQFDYLIPFEFNILTDESVAKRRAWWGDNFVQNIVKVKDTSTLEALSQRITNIIRIKNADNHDGFIFIHPIARWHLYDRFTNWTNTGGRIEYVKLFGAIAGLVLIIACINFMNLATARSEKRIKEVGIRKAIGSGRSQLAWQFLGESMVTTVIAFFASIILSNLLLPIMTSLGFHGVSFDDAINSGGVWIIFGMLGICLVTGLLAGSYPALYLSSFNPVRALKGVVKTGTSALTTRKVLVVTQFTFSIALAIASIVVFRQIQHAKDRPLGYEPSNLLSINATEDLKKNFAPMKQELLNTGVVEAVSKSASPMTGINSAWRDFTWEGIDPDNSVLLSVIMTEYDYEKTSRIKFIQGRAFSPLHASDSTAVLINEATVRTAGFKEPIGQTIFLGDTRLTVIGVVQDVVMQDPFNPVRPAIYLFNGDRVSDIAIRIKDDQAIQPALASIQKVIEKYNPSYPFDYRFVQDVFDKKFELENQVGALAGILAGLAAFISCMGLFGLVSFMAEQRVKEIGIRKILGASVPGIWSLLSSGFVKLVLISLVIATPIAWILLKGWLENYSYRTELSWWVFASTGLVALFITLITVSFQTIRSAMSNPAKCLRSE
jgi:putative ABC transport system permease protein